MGRETVRITASQSGKAMPTLSASDGHVITLQEKDKLEEQNRKKTKTTPHFWNLNEDPQLTGMVVHLVKEGVHRIGNQKAMPPADIVINGLSIQGEHATLENEGDKIVTLTPGEKARILVNGEQITFKITLHHNDRYNTSVQSGRCHRRIQE